MATASINEPATRTEISKVRQEIAGHNAADLLDFYAEVWRGIVSLHHMAETIMLELKHFPYQWVPELKAWADHVTVLSPCEFYAGRVGCQLHKPLTVSLFNSRSEYAETAAVLGWRLFAAALVDRFNDRNELPIRTDGAFTVDVIRNKAIKTLCEIAKKHGYSREDIEAAVMARR